MGLVFSDWSPRPTHRSHVPLFSRVFDRESFYFVAPTEQQTQDHHGGQSNRTWENWKLLHPHPELHLKYIVFR